MAMFNSYVKFPEGIHLNSINPSVPGLAASISSTSSVEAPAAMSSKAAWPHIPSVGPLCQWILARDIHHRKMEVSMGKP